MHAERVNIELLRKGKHAIKAHWLVTLQGEKPARGKELFKPLKIVDNALLLMDNGWIAYAGKAEGKSLAGYERHDFGDICITPRLVNAHTHLQLSWLEGQCEFEAGFTAWLKSMIPQIMQVIRNHSQWTEQKRTHKLEEVFSFLQASGTGLLGDIGGTISGELSRINRLASKKNVTIHNFCEWFGFPPYEEKDIWPERSRLELRNNELAAVSSPAGHALYSTAPEILQNVKKWCSRHKRVFCMHLAESLDEEQCVREGKGPLYELYKDMVLPENWKASYKSPYEMALDLKLIDRTSLFIHGVWLEEQQIKDLVKRGAAICLCPRSNSNLAIGTAPVRTYIESGARICLGTDGLSSNTDLNVLNEAIYYHDKHDLPFRCLIRLLTINGIDALNSNVESRLLEGKRVDFALIPSSLLVN